VAMPSTRDIDRTRADIGPWLARQLGVAAVDVDSVSFPKAGFSNETMFLHAHWQDGDRECDEELVLRIEPTSHQLFVKPDALFQANMMKALARHPGTPVPRVWFTESDTSIVGAPFFVMERSHGRIPADVPSYHAKGWTSELSPDEVSRLSDSGIEALAALHRIDWRDGFNFLDRGRAGHAWESYLDELTQFYEWSASSRVFDTEMLHNAYRYVVDHPPTEPAEGIVWGDARVGNMMFSEDQQVVAMFDWETATLGPPGVDLGWWLMFEEFLSDAQGVPRLTGAPDRAEIVSRYERASGRVIPDIDYYELLACVVMSVINSRLGMLLVQDHGMSDARGGAFARRTIHMADRLLTRIRDPRGQA
jgi:aminoglycoside phosphotransferase (APT) family kinase protein